MMEYDTLLKHIGEFGLYQKIFVCLLSAASICNAITSFALNFIFGEHNQRCRVFENDLYSQPGIVYLNSTHGLETYNVTKCTIENNGSTTKCDNWVYDQTVFSNTIISKFDIVCEKAFYRSHFLMSHYVGLLVGSFLCGILCDTIGRKPTFGIGIVTLLLAEGTRPFIPNYTVVVLMEFFNGAGTVVAYMAPFVLVTEMVGPSKRVLGAFIIYITYCVGYYILLVLAFFLRNWEHLMWAITGIIASYLVILVFLSESPRWLLSRGRKKEALVILRRMGNMNKKHLNIPNDEIEVKENRNTYFLEFIKALIKSKTLTVRLGILCLNWFALIMTYYGIGMNVAKFPGNVFVNYAISISAESAAILLCWVITDRIGRKKILWTAMILGGFACILTIFTTSYADESLGWLTTALAMTGRFCVSISFFTVYLYTAELFPTVLRSSAIGITSTCGRLGALASAYIGELESITESKAGIALPLSIFGTFALVAGFLVLFLPDTTKIILPETVCDAKLLKRKNRNNVPINDPELVELSQQT